MTQFCQNNIIRDENKMLLSKLIKIDCGPILCLTTSYLFCANGKILALIQPNGHTGLTSLVLVLQNKLGLLYILFNEKEDGS